MKTNWLQRRRKKIDQIDHSITDLLLKRRRLVKKIAQLKKTNKLVLRDLKREAEIIKKIKKQTRNRQEKKFLEQIYRALFLYNTKS